MMTPLAPSRLAVSAAQFAGKDPTVSGILPNIIQQIINALFPGLAGLFSICFPTPTPGAIKQHLNEQHSHPPRWHRVLRVASHEAMAVAREHNPPVTLTYAQAQVIASAALDAVRNGSDADVMEAMGQATP